MSCIGFAVRRAQRTLRTLRKFQRTILSRVADKEGVGVTLETLRRLGLPDD